MIGVLFGRRVGGSLIFTLSTGTANLVDHIKLSRAIVNLHAKAPHYNRPERLTVEQSDMSRDHSDEGEVKEMDGHSILVLGVLACPTCAAASSSQRECTWAWLRSHRVTTWVG